MFKKKQRERKIVKCLAGEVVGTHTLEKMPDGSIFVIEKDRGVVDQWTPEYVERVIEPFKLSRWGQERIEQETETIKKEIQDQRNERPVLNPFDTITAEHKGTEIECQFVNYQGIKCEFALVQYNGDLITVDSNTINV